MRQQTVVSDAQAQAGLEAWERDLSPSGLAQDDGVDEPLRGRSVTVVGINYTPEPTGIAPYTTGMAEMLVGFGAHVDVLTGVPHYPSWRVDPAYRWKPRTRELINGVRVQRLRHFVPNRQTALTRGALEASFLAAASLARPSRRPDLVLAATPSLGGAVVGARLARRHGVPFGVVVQDLMGLAAAQSGITGGGRVAETTGRIEGWSLRQAASVAVVSDSFRDQVRAYGVPDERISLLPNWTHIAPARRSREATRAELGWGADTFVVLHTGNMGLKQDLGNVVEAARRLSDRPDILVVLMGDGNQRAVLEEQAVGADRVRIMPPAPGDTYPDVLRAADLLLVNERPTVGDMSLPSKLTSYFSSGNPVLAAVSSDGACAREIVATQGAGVRVQPGEPDELAAAIRTLSGQPERLREMGTASTRYAEAVLGRAAAGRNVLRLVQGMLQG